ncbi:TIGR00529 family membrane protein [Thermococcus sp. Bubb.Bath]|uniref:TIGR00529 family membrane protein n=1 Tax=Thermococcus sp. Bubb.Bath TaxID=1638242 RepID=UPI00143AD30B|nr:TIGR00529 family membrane protein [Thermococcus sp. Bubb.Bath]NJF25626.1 TIGR00529 family membrane protein [Thermococcus sp. Bubb.Bath]
MNGILFIAASFGLILILIRLKVNIGVSIFLGSIVLGALFGLKPEGLLEAFYSSSTSWSTLRLIIIIATIMALAEVFSQTGYLKLMEEAVRNLFPDERYSLAALPALIGLMPMPAGALVSAPMIEGVSEKLSLSPERKTLTNYWFRHIWEHSWPMYQAIIITSVILGVSVGTLSAHLFAMTVIMALVGYFHILMPLKSVKTEGRDLRKGSILFLRTTYPIFIIILISVVLGYDMVYGAIAGLLSVLIPSAKRITGKAVAKYALQPKIIFLLFAVMYFKEVLEVTGAIKTLPKAILSVHFPVAAVVMITPFVVGLITGMSFAYAGMTFPILSPFLVDYKWIALAYLSGYMGMLFSPVHLCLIFSAEYYRADLGRVYRELLIPSLLLFFAGLAYIFLVL